MAAFTYSEAMDMDPSRFQLAINAEWEAMLRFGVFEIVPSSHRPRSAQLLNLMWQFSIKSDGRYKARLCARGDQQKLPPGVNNYAPASQSANVRLNLAHAGWCAT